MATPVVFFTIPKPFTGENTTIQRNSITSWKQLALTQDVVLCGDEEGIGAAAEELECGWLPTAEKSPNGVPLISSVFRQVQGQFPADTYCFINADILILDDFDEVITQVSQELDSYLVVARRINLAVTNKIDPRVDWQVDLREKASRDGRFIPLWNSGADVHVFTSGLFNDIPPFVMGRFHWDRWMMRHALDSGAALVDASPSLLVLHQNHNYEHILRPSAEAKAFFPGEDDIRVNLQLAGRTIAYLPNASHSVRNGRVIAHKGTLVGLGYLWMRAYGASRRSTTRVLSINPDVFRFYLRASSVRDRLLAKIPLLSVTKAALRRSLARFFGWLPK